MSKKPANRSNAPLYWSAETWAFVALRLFLALLFITAGYGKFVGSDGFSLSTYHQGFYGYITETYAEQSPLPKFLLAPYAFLIGYVEVILGVLLLLGVKTKYTLAGYALTLVSLAFGQMLLSTSESAQAVNQISLYLLATCAALYFVRHNKFEALR